MIVLRVLFFVFSLVHSVQSGRILSGGDETSITSLSRRPSFLTFFFGRISESFTKFIHIIGGFVPLRGIASVASDIGIPGAGALQHYLTPRTKRTLRNKSEPSNSVRRSYTILKETVNSAVLGLLGYKKCLLRAACYLGKRLSASVTGTSALTLLLSTISNQLPDSLTEIYTTLRNSIFYSNDCEQYECPLEDLTFPFLKERLQKLLMD